MGNTSKATALDNALKPILEAIKARAVAKGEAQRAQFLDQMLPRRIKSVKADRDDALADEQAKAAQKDAGDRGAASFAPPEPTIDPVRPEAQVPQQMKPAAGGVGAAAGPLTQAPPIEQALAGARPGQTVQGMQRTTQPASLDIGLGAPLSLGFDMRSVAPTSVNIPPMSEFVDRVAADIQYNPENVKPRVSGLVMRFDTKTANTIFQGAKAQAAANQQAVKQERMTRFSQSIGLANSVNPEAGGGDQEKLLKSIQNDDVGLYADWWKDVGESSSVERGRMANAMVATNVERSKQDERRWGENRNIMQVINQDADVPGLGNTRAVWDVNSGQVTLQSTSGATAGEVARQAAIDTTTVFARIDRKPHWLGNPVSTGQFVSERSPIWANAQRRSMATDGVVWMPYPDGMPSEKNEFDQPDMRKTSIFELANTTIGFQKIDQTTWDRTIDLFEIVQSEVGKPRKKGQQSTPLEQALMANGVSFKDSSRVALTMTAVHRLGLLGFDVDKGTRHLILSESTGGENPLNSGIGTFVHDELIRNNQALTNQFMEFERKGLPFGTINHRQLAPVDFSQLREGERAVAAAAAPTAEPTGGFGFGTGTGEFPGGATLGDILKGAARKAVGTATQPTPADFGPQPRREHAPAGNLAEEAARIRQERRRKLDQGLGQQ